MIRFKDIEKSKKRMTHILAITINLDIEVQNEKESFIGNILIFHQNYGLEKEYSLKYLKKKIQLNQENWKMVFIYKLRQ